MHFLRVGRYVTIFETMNSPINELCFDIDCVYFVKKYLDFFGSSDRDFFKFFQSFFMYSPVMYRKFLQQITYMYMTPPAINFQ